jgi:hypothetical protein
MLVKPSRARRQERKGYWARALLLLANFGKEGRPEPIIAKVSQETLAEMIGTTRSRVSHFMNKFRQLGFIDYNGTMEIDSSLLSVVLHDQPHIKTWAIQRIRSAPFWMPITLGRAVAA